MTVPRAPSEPIETALAAALRTLGAAAAPNDPAPRVTVGLSGGRDSMVLLDALARIAPGQRIRLSALHVHHGLSPHAGAWAAFCAAECARRAVPLTVERVDVRRDPGASGEASARAARYAAFAGADTDVIALAHHADDQAETLLLQMLRGAGPAGLGAMPVLRRGPVGPAILRPLLALPRAAIEAYAAAGGIDWIDDESNADTRIRRNYLRREIGPRLAYAFPGFPATLVRAARLQAEAADLLDDLAALDAGNAIIGGEGHGSMLDRGILAALPPARARNLLRWFLRRHGLPAPSSARLGAMLAQLAGAAPDARVRLAHAGVEIGLHRGRVVVHPPPIGPYSVSWNGESRLALPHGVLEWTPVAGAGIADEALAKGRVVVRSRRGGELIRLAVDGPMRALKGLLQRARVPAWERDELPLVLCDEMLVAVPGIGIDVRCRAAPGARGHVLHWHPAPRAPRG